jgi:hypothetical protein
VLRRRPAGADRAMRSPEKAPPPSHLPTSILQRLAVALHPLMCATSLDQDACEVAQARRYICALAGTHASPAVRSVTHAALFGRWGAVRQVRTQHVTSPTSAMPLSGRPKP